jgi:hypothetical protein
MSAPVHDRSIAPVGSDSWADPELSLRRAGRYFFTFTGPRLLAPVTAAALATRLFLGQWAPRDAVIAGVILGLEPLTEWVIHVFLLHFRPRVVLGRRVDPLVARKHRAHHRDPKDPELVFIPLPVLGVSVVLAVVGYGAGFGALRPAVMALAVSYAMLLTYEWTHFLIHSSYRPRHVFYRGLWRAHRLHHYRNEHYWFGVTVHLGDRLLRTYPARDDVPLSTTVRSLDAAAST